MAKCKCNCGAEVREGTNFLPGHYAKWKADQKKINSVLKGGSSSSGSQILSRTEKKPESTEMTLGEMTKIPKKIESSVLQESGDLGSQEDRMVAPAVNQKMPIWFAYLQTPPSQVQVKSPARSWKVIKAIAIFIFLLALTAGSAAYYLGVI